MQRIAPPGDFETLSKQTLRFLQERFGFALWMVTRVQGNDWIVLNAADQGYGVSQGRVLRWADSFCTHMVRGEGPRVAPDSDLVPAYATAEVARQMPIKAYIGIPLTTTDGALFGTLCAIDPHRQPKTIVNDQALVELLGSMLSAVLSGELRAEEALRRQERVAARAQIDPQTHLFNRAAWLSLLDSEERRSRTYGLLASFIAVRLVGLDRLAMSDGPAAVEARVVASARAVEEVFGEPHLIARLENDTLGVLALGCDQPMMESFERRLNKTLGGKGLSAAVGGALCSATHSFERSWQEALATVR